MFGKKVNLFDLKFRRNPSIKWELNESGKVVLAIENDGVFDKIAQKFFHRPPVSYIEMDELGTTVWLALETMDDIMTISEVVHDKFGEKAEPLLPRLGTFFQTLLANELIEKK